MNFLEQQFVIKLILGHKRVIDNSVGTSLKVYELDGSQNSEANERYLIYGITIQPPRYLEFLVSW